MAEQNITPPPATPGGPAAPKAAKAGKRKKRVSRSLKSIEVAERGMAKASARISEAVAKGFETYLQRRDRSADERRDGALRDAPKNLARGVGKAVRSSSRAPIDLAKVVDTKPMTKQLRKVARMFMRAW